MFYLVRRYSQIANFTLLMACAIVPMYFYSKSSRVPATDQQLQEALKDFAPEKRVVDARKSAEMKQFWKERGPSAGVVDDEEFDLLLRAGKSAMKRHYELTGPLGEIEAADKKKDKAQAAAAAPKPK